jgi:hypothetical protein
MKRVFLPSRIRRGRCGTSPVWLAEHAGRWRQFGRKCDAGRYERTGCADHKTWLCSCGGREPDLDLAWLERQEQGHERNAMLLVESEAAHAALKVKVLPTGGTLARFHVRILETRWSFHAGEERLVPKYAITFEEPSNNDDGNTEAVQ